MSRDWGRLGPMQHDVLDTLATSTRMTSPVLAVELGTTGAKVRRALHALWTRGLVARSAGPARGYHYDISPAGRAALEHLRAMGRHPGVAP